MIYFDNAATSFPKAPTLQAELGALYAQIGVNPSRGHYGVSQELSKQIQEARDQIANHFNVNSKGVIFSPSATYSLNQIISGLSYEKIKNVYISPFEHNAVLRPLYFLQKQNHFRLSFLPFNGFKWDQDKTEKLFRLSPPNLIVCTHASNVFGNILPIKEIFELGKEYSSITVLDCAQTAGLIPTDLQDLHADFASFAGHKTFYGPSGIGGLIINSSISLNPIVLGGTGINSAEKEMPLDLPERFEAGSLNTLGILGLLLSTKWLNRQQDIVERKNELFHLLYDRLMNCFGIRIITEPSIPNVGIISCVWESCSPTEVGMFLDRHEICVRTGMHCAPIAHEHMHTAPEGTVRFSLGVFNSKHEIESLSACLAGM